MHRVKGKRAKPLRGGYKEANRTGRARIRLEWWRICFGCALAVLTEHAATVLLFGEVASSPLAATWRVNDVGRGLRGGCYDCDWISAEERLHLSLILTPEVAPAIFLVGQARFVKRKRFERAADRHLGACNCGNKLPGHDR